MGNKAIDWGVWLRYDQNPLWIKIKLLKSVIQGFWPGLGLDSLRIMQTGPGITGLVIEGDPIELKSIDTGEGDCLWMGHSAKSNVLVFR